MLASRSVQKRRMRPAMLAFALVLAIASMLSMAGCSRGGKVLGDIDESAPVVLMHYEAASQDMAGIVYREILDLPAFLAEAKQPVMLVFHNPGDAVEPQLIPLVEQFADDYRDTVSVVFIDAGAKPALASLYGIETVPEYILVQSGTARLTMNGFDETTRSGLERMIQMAG